MLRVIFGVFFIDTNENYCFSLFQYTTQTVLSTIQNADGTVSLIQVDPNNPIITLPDGTTAQVQGVATVITTDFYKKTPIKQLILITMSFWF